MDIFLFFPVNWHISSYLVISLLTEEKKLEVYAPKTYGQEKIKLVIHQF